MRNSIDSWIFWLSEHSRAVLSAIVAVFLLLFAGFLMLSKFGKSTLNDYLSSNQVLPLCESGIKRVQEASPAYASYAKNSLAIVQGKYAQALQDARMLKADLQKKSSDANALLYQFNLLRIATLAGRLGSAQDELEGWQELVRNGEEHPREWRLFLECFQKEDLSLLDYVQARLFVLRA